MDQASNLRPIWVPSPDRVAQSVMTAFRGFAMERSGEAFPDTRALHAWSLQAPAAFWETVWDFFDVPGEKGTRSVRARAGDGRGALLPGRRSQHGRGAALGGTGRSRVRTRSSLQTRQAPAPLVMGPPARGGGKLPRRPRGRGGGGGRPRRGSATQHPRGGGGDAGHRSRSARCGRRPRRTSGSAACLTASGRSRPRC